MSVAVKSESLPEISELKKRLKSLCEINELLIPDEEELWLRVHTDVEGADSFRVDNGSGDRMFVIFSEHGCIIKGFDHESPFTPYARKDMSVWPGIYDEVPENLLEELNDVCYGKNDVTFCVWRENSDSEWRKGDIENPNNYDDGFNLIESYLFSTPEECFEWAEEYFELENEYEEGTLTLEMVKELYK